MSAFDNPRVLPNVIPHDENDNPVAVQWYYDPVTKEYFPANSDSGSPITAIGPRQANFEVMHSAITVADTVIPTTPLGLFDFSNYANIVVDIKLEGVSPFVTLLPLYWNSITQGATLGNKLWAIANVLFPQLKI